MTRVSTDFTANFDPVSNPIGGTVIAAIGNSKLSATLGSAGTTTPLRLASLSGSGNSSKKLTIHGDVTLIITASAGSSAITLTNRAPVLTPRPQCRCCS